MAQQHKSKASTKTLAIPTSKVEQHTTELRTYVQSHKRSARLFSWDVGERLNAIQQVVGEGSSEFGAFMKNLGVLKRGGVGVPEKSGYRYLSKYKQAIDVFPKPVIDALLAENILPGKQSVLDAVAGSEAIRKELDTIRAAVEQNRTHFIPGLCSAIVTRIRDAGTGTRRVEPLFVTVSDSLCWRFRSLLAPYDGLIKSGKVKLPEKTPTEDELKEQAKELAKGMMLTLMRCTEGGWYFPERLGSVFTQTVEIGREEFQLEDRQV